MARHVPPSRTRYEAANPVVSTRVPRELFAELEEAAAAYDRSIAAVIRDALAGKIGSSKRVQETETQLKAIEERAAQLAKRSNQLENRCRQLEMEVAAYLRLDQQQRADIVRLEQQATTESASARNSERQLAEIASPDGRHHRCPECERAWHEHFWDISQSAWRCQQFITIVP